MRDFTVNFVEATTVTPETLRDAAEFFGEQFGFVRKVVAVSGNST